MWCLRLSWVIRERAFGKMGCVLDWVLSGPRDNLMISLCHFYLESERNKSTKCVICKCEKPLSEPREELIGLFSWWHPVLYFGLCLEIGQIDLVFECVRIFLTFCEIFVKFSREHYGTLSCQLLEPFDLMCLCNKIKSIILF